MDRESLAHTKWNCKYHIVFAPKYRRQVVYGRLRAEIGKILRDLCKRKGIDILEAEEQPDDLRPVREPEIQVWEPGVLVPRVLC